MYDERAERELDFQRTRSSEIKVASTASKQEGKQEGVAIGQIQLLQKLLGETPSSAIEFANLALEDLQRRVLELQTRFQNRGA